MALKIIAIRPKTALLRSFNYSNIRFRTSTMKKYICILASAALLAACEQKTETTEPAATPTPTTPPPAAYARTATQALTNVTYRYVELLADFGLEGACEKQPALIGGINTRDGRLTCQAVAEAHGLKYEPPL